MATLSAGKGTKSSFGSIKYVVFEKNSKNIRVQMVAGIECSSYYKDAEEEFRNVASAYQKSRGQQAHHMVIGFSDRECNQFSKRELMEKACSISRKLFPGHQVWLGLHTDTKHPHVHMIVHSVNFETGKKLHINGRQGMHRLMSQLQSLAPDLGLDTDLKVGKKKPKVRGQLTTRNAVERKVLEAGNSWKSNMALLVIEALENATSKREFIQACEMRGIHCNWAENRRHIVFQSIDIPKHKARAKNLSETFTLPELADKESIQQALHRNYEKVIEEIYARPVHALEHKILSNPSEESNNQSRDTISSPKKQIKISFPHHTGNLERSR